MGADFFLCLHRDVSWAGETVRLVFTDANAASILPDMPAHGDMAAFGMRSKTWGHSAARPQAPSAVEHKVPYLSNFLRYGPINYEL